MGNVNDMVLLRFGDTLFRWAVETLGHRCLQNQDQQMVHPNRNHSDDKHDDVENCDSKVSGLPEGDNTGEGIYPVKLTQCSEHSYNPCEDNDTRAREWWPMSS
jgi:hypothetical protein